MADATASARARAPRCDALLIARCGKEDIVQYLLKNTLYKVLILVFVFFKTTVSRIIIFAIARVTLLSLLFS